MSGELSTGHVDKWLESNARSAHPVGMPLMPNCPTCQEVAASVGGPRREHSVMAADYCCPSGHIWQTKWPAPVIPIEGRSA